MTKWVTYKSIEWFDLIQCGWFTWRVEGEKALMYYNRNEKKNSLYGRV